MRSPIYITRPILPPLGALQKQLSEIWKSGWLTNMGVKHALLEKRLQKELKVPHVSIFNNGSIALLAALKALDLPMGSEVITTPFTFPATPHCISWNGLTPVFCDIEPKTMTIDADRIEALITPRTSAILAVHVYGFPCRTDKISAIARKHRLKVVYDGAHTFSTRIKGKGIGTFGDITMFSFHATKLFHTVEGGCLTYKDGSLKEKIYNLRNFGIRNEDEVVDIGINGKMNEIQAAIGLLNLNLYRKEQRKRQQIRARYDRNLSRIKGVTIPRLARGVTDSCSYYPIFIEDGFPVTRDALYDGLKRHKVFARKYFYPLCSDYAPYRNLASASAKNLPVANKINKKVLCLPFYGQMSKTMVDRICKMIVRPAVKSGGK